MKLKLRRVKGKTPAKIQNSSSRSTQPIFNTQPESAGNERPEKMKPVENLDLIWFGPAMKYPDFHKLSKGSRYGSAKFTLLAPGCPVVRYKEEFGLTESDIKIWKWEQTYNKEVSTCYLFTTVDHEKVFLPHGFEPISLQLWQSEYLDPETKSIMRFRLRQYTDERYDTISFAFEQPEKGCVWKINPFSASLSLVQHLPNNIKCKNGQACSEITQWVKPTATKEEWNKKIHKWKQQATTISEDDKNQLRALRKEVMDPFLEAPNNQVQFENAITSALFQRICDCLKGIGYQVARETNGNGSIRYKVDTTKDSTFTLDYYYGRVKLSRFKTGKYFLEQAIKRLNPEKILTKVAPTAQPSVPRPPLADRTNLLTQNNTNAKAVPTKVLSTSAQKENQLHNVM